MTGDTAGNLYGTTFSGGQFGGGIVYRLNRKSNGDWADAVVYSFRGGGSMWPNPVAGVTFGKGGTAFGTTLGGGFTVDAAIYELKR